MNIYILHTQITELPKQDSVCPVNLIDFSETSSYDAIGLSNEECIILYQSPNSILASLLKLGMSSTQAIKDTEVRVSFLVKIFKASRAKVRLIAIDNTEINTGLPELKDCSQLISDLKKTVKSTENGLYDIAAKVIVMQNRSLVKLSQQLEACSEVPFQDVAVDIEQIINSGRLKKEQDATELAQLQKNLQKEQQTKVDLEIELKATQLDKAQLEQSLAQEKKSSKEQSQNLTNKLEQVEKENELIIQQLHHVQEELEYQFISKSELAKQHSIVSSNKRDAETYSFWIKGLYHRAAKEHYKSNRRYRNTLKKQIQLITQSSLFDEQWYLNTYPDLKGSIIEPALHYLLYGVAEGRNPSAGFNTMNYIFTYTDVAESGINPLLHFIKFGQAENREADPRRKCLPAPKNNQ